VWTMVRNSTGMRRKDAFGFANASGHRIDSVEWPALSPRMGALRLSMTVSPLKHRVSGGDIAELLGNFWLLYMAFCP
jgi:hypothetical protein